MKVALLGYGKMGKEIEAILLERGHSVEYILNSEGKKKGGELGEMDVAIEFSTPSTVLNNISTCFDDSLPIVTGTTGWDQHRDEITQTCMTTNNTLFYASNYSIGVNIFFAINKKLAEIMNSHPEYNIQMEETHHMEKLDAPSGTAITLAENIISNVSRKSSWVNTESDDEGDIPIISNREGEIPGTHIVSYESSIDQLEIKHAAKNRKGFALGAVLAAEWVKDKKGVYNMNNFLNI